MGKKIDLVITDLDNTVYDWVGYYVPSVHRLIEKIEQISGTPRETILEDIRRINRKHGTTEYDFAINELSVLPSSDRALSPRALEQKYAPARVAFREAERELLRPYPGVMRTLQALADSGIPVVGFSDSMGQYVVNRLRKLRLADFFSGLVAPATHPIPRVGIEGHSGLHSDEEVGFSGWQVVLPQGLRKPNPNTISPVLDNLGVARERTLYVGDSLTRDIRLAQGLGLMDVWARYGSVNVSSHYRSLLEITYWTPEQVKDEERSQAFARDIQPKTTIDCFDELLYLCGQ